LVPEVDSDGGDEVGAEGLVHVLDETAGADSIKKLQISGSGIADMNRATF
jgi:hypothetical protein